MSESNLYHRLGGENAVNALVGSVYEKILDDYRVSRFFNDTETDKQVETLKKLVSAILHHAELKPFLTDFFMVAFARFKDKERYPDSALDYFGYIIGQDNPSTKWLCDSHSHLLKFMPEDSHYDVVMEHLTTSLQALNLDSAVVAEVLAFAESGRNGVLGK
jgi:truncated hemoglobin YjbI